MRSLLFELLVSGSVFEVLSDHVVFSPFLGEGVLYFTFSSLLAET